MSIFEISPEDIEGLTDSNLRKLIGYLAEQEVTLQGHSARSVTYGGHQNASDGGIDVRVNLDADVFSGYIPRPKPVFK